jgi:hypothetical protein
MFSCSGSHDNKAPNFSHLVKITLCPFNTSPNMKISCLRSNKFDDKISSHVIQFLFQNFKEFPQVSICSVPKTQRSNSAVSSYGLISKVFSTKFHTVECATSRPTRRVSYFFCDAETVVSHSPLLSLCHDNLKICIGQLEVDPSCSVTCMSLRLAMLACGSSLATSTAQD